VRARSVLVVLVVKDDARALPACLLALSRQTHPRLGVVAVDTGSTDGSAELLESALGPERVLRRPGLASARAVAEVLRIEPAQRADYLLLLHADTALEPEAVAALVRAAERVEGAGVVGPKVVDWDRPEVLQEVGLSADRLGYPYSPLEEGEIDQGQYDRMREVLFVSSCAQLVSRQALARIGPPDERLGPHHDELDFCWRARLAGYRVLMTPAAVARRRALPADAAPRYHRERTALAGVLKNYGAVSLLWILPLYLAQGVIRLALLVLARRFQDATEILAAWGWNLAHLPGTLSRRVRVQALRAVPDRAVRRIMAPATIRLRRWGQAAVQLLVPLGGEREEGEGREWMARRLALAHPGAMAWILAAVLAAVAYRHLFGASPLTGAGLQVFPASASDFFRELLSGARHTGLGGTAPASPALGLLGVGSVLALGHPALLQKVLLLALPGLAGAGCYRAVRPVADQRLAAVVAAACYGLSGPVLWTLSEGRLPALVFLAGLPWLAAKLALPFDRGFRMSAPRWVAGAGLGLAVLASFFPGTLLAGAAVLVSLLVVPERGWRPHRGVGLTLSALAAAAALALPLTLGLVSSRGSALADPAPRASFATLARLSPVGAGWPVELFLPAAAALALGFVSGPASRPALRAAVGAVVGLYLAWLSGTGYLPAPLSNVTAYLGVAAFGSCLAVAAGLAALVRGVSEASFGARQIGTAALAVVLAGGLGAQAVRVGRGGWAIGGPERIPASYAVAGEAGGPPYRVLWVGRADGQPFPAPGGVPDGVVTAGGLSVRFAVRDPQGASVLDMGRAAAGPGYRALARTLGQLLGGRTAHAGALLAPFGVRFVVAGAGDLPRPVLRRLQGQLDLDPVPAQGLVIFRNPVAVPLASWVPGEEWAGAVREPDVDPALPAPDPVPLSGSADTLRGGSTGSRGVVLLSEQYDPAWRLRSGRKELRPVRAFGWATAFPGPLPSRSFELGRKGSRTPLVAAMAVLWAGALWLTRRPTRSG
jgi:GT2 family glycosyltransferase